MARAALQIERPRDLKTKCRSPNSPSSSNEMPSPVLLCHVMSAVTGGEAGAKAGSTHLHAFQGRGAAKLAPRTGSGRLLQ